MKQLSDAFSTYPWMLPLLLGVLLIGVAATVAVLLILKKREQKHMQEFVVLDEKVSHESENRPEGPAPAPVFDDDDGKTMRLFDYPDTGLKSYQLNLYDLNSPGVVYRVNLSDRVVIGRRASCDVCIPNGTLSGEHCEILLKNGKMYLHDLNSTNGTFLNGNANRVTEEELASGSVFEMGAIRLKAELAVFQM